MATMRTMGTALVVLAMATAAAAAGSPYDHLQCFKLKDPASPFVAFADLRPLDSANFEVDTGCKIKTRSRELCIPVQKDRTDEGPRLAVEGQDLANAFLCYAVKCPADVRPAPLLMSDQFASRQLAPLRTTKLCAPAIVGPAPTTTTTTLPQGVAQACTGATPPACDGTCGSQAFACVPDTGGTACMCDGVDIFYVCGLLAGPPNCLGTCNGESSCIDAGDGSCQCARVVE